MDAPPPSSLATPQETRASLLLREALKVMQPLAEAMVANGVTYPRFAQALKAVFLEAARRELDADDKKITDSALSLLSGVHRKDVRSFGAGHEPGYQRGDGAGRALSLANEVATRWLTDANFLDANGTPLALPLRNAEADADTNAKTNAKAKVKTPSFEDLAQSVSKDFHARSLLDELQRLGLVAVEGDLARLQPDGFVPKQDFSQYAAFFGDNLRDHAAASASNLRNTLHGTEPNFLEYALFADELTDKAAAQLQLLARTLWKTAFQEMRETAQHHVDASRPKLRGARGTRMKFGVYFYAEPAEDASLQQTHAPSESAAAKTAARNKAQK